MLQVDVLQQMVCKNMQLYTTMLTTLGTDRRGIWQQIDIFMHACKADYAMWLVLEKAEQIKLDGSAILEPRFARFIEPSNCHHSEQKSELHADVTELLDMLADQDICREMHHTVGQAYKALTSKRIVESDRLAELAASCKQLLVEMAKTKMQVILNSYATVYRTTAYDVVGLPVLCVDMPSWNDLMKDAALTVMILAAEARQIDAQQEFPAFSWLYQMAKTAQLDCVK